MISHRLPGTIGNSSRNEWQLGDMPSVDCATNAMKVADPGETALRQMCVLPESVIVTPPAARISAPAHEAFLMPPKNQPPGDVDTYIAKFPLETQRKLQQVRNAVRRADPRAEETISYGMPAYVLNGRGLLGFAGYKHHIGLYPAPVGNANFNERLARYRAFKSTIRFPLDEPIPLDLVAQIVKLRVRDNLKRSRERAKSRQK